MKTSLTAEELIKTIEQFAHLDRGNGHYVRCHGYKVEVDLNYEPVSCECKDYQYRQFKTNGSCKHMNAVKAFYAPDLGVLKSDRNPVVWTSRRGRLVPVRWTQLSQEEARNWYRDHYENDYSFNYA